MIRRIYRALGWFSFGLGAIQLTMPNRFLTMIGIMPTPMRRVVTRLVGVRELGVVPGLLTDSRPVGWLAARVVGDIIDLAMLSRARRAEDTNRGAVTAAMAAVTGIFAIDLGAAIAARSDAQRRARHPGRIVRTVTVNRPAEELYRFWRDFENLPRVMPHLEGVEVRGANLSHWIASAPVGTRVEWDAEIVDDRPNELISWRSVEGSQVRSSGSVRFQPAPGQRGTEVIVEMDYDPPGGPVGAVVAMISGEEPRQQIADALRRFKQVMETGEPILSEATLNGRKILQRPAQPPPEEPGERRLPVAAGMSGSLP